MLDEKMYFIEYELNFDPYVFNNTSNTTEL